MQDYQQIEDRRIESERDFHNERFAHEVRQPTHGFYRVVQPAFDYYEWRLKQLVCGRDVLEYGCGTGLNTRRLAGQVKCITGIDLSDVAIQQACAAAECEQLVNTTFLTMNAEQMTFADESFDVVFGSSILHHLDLSTAYASIARVLRPHGKAIFLEPLGHNPLINAYRQRTPEFRTPDEHPLLKQDIALSRKFFARHDSRLFGMTTLAAIPLLSTPMGNAAIHVGQVIDRLLLRIPGLRWHAWFSVLEFTK
jgi:SAM-dependent methyltransferase